MQWIGLNIIMRKNETCRAARYSLRSIPLGRSPSTPPPLTLSRQPPSATANAALVPRECCTRALKPKSRKFGPFPAPVPPSTTPQGMHFSYPHDITASHSVHSINRSGKWEESDGGGKKKSRETTQREFGMDSRCKSRASAR